VTELCSELIELESLWGSAANDLRDALLEAPGVEAKFRCLVNFLLRRMRRSHPHDTFQGHRP
jgi:hypothetical protein